MVSDFNLERLLKRFEELDAVVDPDVSRIKFYWYNKSGNRTEEEAPLAINIGTGLNLTPRGYKLVCSRGLFVEMENYFSSLGGGWKSKGIEGFVRLSGSSGQGVLLRESARVVSVKEALREEYALASREYSLESRSR